MKYIGESARGCVCLFSASITVLDAFLSYGQSFTRMMSIFEVWKGMTIGVPRVTPGEQQQANNNTPPCKKVKDSSEVGR